MNMIRLAAAFLTLAAVSIRLDADARAAEVKVTERDDCLRVEVDGRLFTEWRHGDWAAPYLYPVIGPNGESVTRHYPMKAGLAGEEQDHPWHRSIRFSHSDVNGFNFWWAPGKEKAKHTAEIRLERIERLTSGATGEAIFWNRWLGDGKLVLREKVRLAFTPLENRQMLIDYDVDLQAADGPVVFGDKRDGGMLIRVAGTMKVESEKDVPGDGVIVNSRGDRNRDAWGKRAEWTDYSGPDATGRTVGVALFDHPKNLRFPTHWHARTYGLLTSNRFGTDHFRGAYGDHKTVVCRPHGDACPACNSHAGDYMIAAGATLSLKHRFYVHQGDSQAADVARRYREYASDAESVVLRMRELHRERRWKDFLEQFAEEPIASWPDEFAERKAEAFHLRGQVHAFSKNGAAAESDLKQATTLAPRHEPYWLTLGENYVNNLNDDARALAAYRQSLAISGAHQGWTALTATTAIARILTGQTKTDEALEILKPYGDLAKMAPTWRIRLLRAYGHVYAAQGREQESLEKFREALRLESR